MSAEILLRAASLIRKRAEAATPGPWTQNGFEYDDEADVFTYDVAAASDSATSLLYADSKGNAEHVASWHPAVALAVADWLDRVADDAADGIFDQMSEALPIARTFLGESA